MISLATLVPLGVQLPAVSSSYAAPLHSAKQHLHTSRETGLRKRNWIAAVLPNKASETPTPGVVVYRRSSIQTHYEYQTTLELLGLRKVSTEVSRDKATSMGIVCPGSETATPVSISFDVSKNKESGDLRLEGVVRTAIVTSCNRCLAPVAEKIFSSFSVLLTKKPVEEPKQQTIGVVLGEKVDPDEPVLDIDLDDKIHFPSDVKEVDLSKYIRDTLHLDMPYVSVCSSSCKGLCVECGRSLNTEECTCKASPVETRK